MTAVTVVAFRSLTLFVHCLLRQRFCTEIGANLASIHSSDEYDFVRQVINRAAGKDEESWVGGYDAAKVSVWSDCFLRWRSFRHSHVNI